VWMHGFCFFFWWGSFHRLWKSSAFVTLVLGMVRKNRDVVVYVIDRSYIGSRSKVRITPSPLGPGHTVTWAVSSVHPRKAVQFTAHPSVKLDSYGVYLKQINRQTK